MIPGIDASIEKRWGPTTDELMVLWIWLHQFLSSSVMLHFERIDTQAVFPVEVQRSNTSERWTDWFVLMAPTPVTHMQPVPWLMSWRSPGPSRPSNTLCWPLPAVTAHHYHWLQGFPRGVHIRTWPVKSKQLCHLAIGIRIRYSKRAISHSTERRSPTKDVQFTTTEL